MSETITASPKLLDPSSRILSRLQAGDESVSSLLLDDDALMLGSVPTRPHRKNPLTKSPEDRVNPMETKKTGSENHSPPLLPGASAKNDFNVVLEAGHPEVRYNKETHTPGNDIPGAKTATISQVMAPDDTSKNASSTPNGADSATKATKTQSSLVMKSEPPKETQNAQPTPAIAADQTDIHNVGQSNQREKVSWRPRFLKSRRERVSGGLEDTARPPLSGTSRLVP